MSQRLLWAAIGVVLVALLANLYMQQRSAAAMNVALVKLTEQMGRGQPPTGEARIKVVDENGEPRAGVKVTVCGVNPSPYLSNATYARDFESDGGGIIRTGPILLGEYKLQARNAGAYWFMSMEGGFRLLNNAEAIDVTFTAPRPRLAKVTIEPAGIDGGWKPYERPSLHFSKRFDRTSVRAGGTFEFGKSAEVPLLPGVDVEISYQLERKYEQNQQRFDAAEKLSASDPALVDGGTIRLGLPRGRSSSLTAEGEEVSHRAASRPAE